MVEFALKKKGAMVLVLVLKTPGSVKTVMT